MTETLGKETAQNVGALGELLPELVHGGQRLWPFGRGLAAGAEDPEVVWKMVVAQIAVTQEDRRNVQVLRGFLNALNERNPQLSNRLLDDAVQDAALANFIPLLQIAVGVDDRGLRRLKRALTRGSGSIEVFRHLAWGRPLELISGADFRELVLTIAVKRNGLDVAVEILAMRLHSDEHEKRSHDCEVIEAGRALMRQLSIKKGCQQGDYKLGEIVTACLRGQDGASIAQDVCRKLKHAVSKNETYASDNSRLIQSLLKMQPAAVLDALFDDNKSERQQRVRIIETIGHVDANPFDAVQESDVFEWCDRDPPNRYPTIASVISFLRRTDEKAPLQWTATALRLLEKAPDRVAVLKEFVRRFSPMSWSGSRAAVVEARAKLLDELDGYPDAGVVNYIAREKMRLAQAIEQERQWENQRDKAADERFE